MLGTKLARRSGCVDWKAFCFHGALTALKINHSFSDDLLLLVHKTAERLCADVPLTSLVILAKMAFISGGYFHTELPCYIEHTYK